ncbi:MAG: hypothetical protein WC879_11320 [Melioribacteraceae bacterium]
MIEKILNDITDYYLTSPDYNGLTVRSISEKYSLSFEELPQLFIKMVENDLIEFRFGDFHQNIHIKALNEYPKEETLKIINPTKIQNSCVYPSKEHLKKIVDKNKYEGRPFALALAQGENQLAFRSFDLSILEFYRNDPRYYYKNSDIAGSIYYSEDGEKDIDNPNNIYLQDFGFSYNSKKERAIAVYLRRLAILSPEHQQLWNSRILEGDYKLHPDFYRSSILGYFPEGISIYEAFIKEQYKINKLCDNIGYPPLFKTIYSGSNRPKEFSILLRPTLREYNNFILILDKIISENFNEEYFTGLEKEIEETRKDGKIIIKKKGTIELFNEWIRKNFKPDHPDSYDNIIKPLKMVRRMRQEPAHAIRLDIFNQKYIHDQRKIMTDVFGSLHIFRLILEQHPYVDEKIVSEIKNNYKIWLE